MLEDLGSSTELTNFHYHPQEPVGGLLLTHIWGSRILLVSVIDSS